MQYRGKEKQSLHSRIGAVNFQFYIFNPTDSDLNTKKWKSERESGYHLMSTNRRQFGCLYHYNCYLCCRSGCYWCFCYWIVVLVCYECSRRCGRCCCIFISRYCMVLPTTTFPFDIYMFRGLTRAFITFHVYFSFDYRVSFFVLVFFFSFSPSRSVFSFNRNIFVCTLPLSLIIVTIYVIIRFGSENEITVVYHLICFSFRHYCEFVVKKRMKIKCDIVDYL